MDTQKIERYFVEHPQIAWIINLCGLILFALATYSLLSKSFLFAYDQPLLEQLTKVRNSSPQGLLTIVDVADKFGNVGTAIIGTALGFYWLWKGRARKFTLLLASLVGNTLLFLAVAYLFGRVGPEPTHLLGLVLLPSYPSGHVMATIGLYAMLLYVYLPQLASTGWQVIVFLGGVALILLVAFLRLYEGAHFLTDVVAGLGLGAAWSAFALMLVDRYLYNRRRGE